MKVSAVEMTNANQRILLVVFLVIVMSRNGHELLVGQLRLTHIPPLLQ
jgi:hypothetical protein